MCPPFVSCPPFSARRVETLFTCLPGLSLLVSALFRWPCSISIHLSPESVTADSLSLLACALFRSISIHVSPRLLLLVSALFRWPCSISIHLSPRSVTVGVRPFPLATQHFYSCAKEFTVRGSQFSLRWPCSVSVHLPGSAAGVRPFPLATQYFYSRLPGDFCTKAF